MAKTLSQVRAEREEAVVMQKLAAVQEALGDDPQVVSTLDRALDIVKEAGVTDVGEQLDLATKMTIDHLGLVEGDESSGNEKTASAEDIDAGFQAGVDCAEVAFAAGVTLEDIEKVASEEEADALGRFLAHALVTVNQNAE